MKAEPERFTIASIELSSPLTPLPTNGREVFALARWQGTPLGWLHLVAENGQVQVEDIRSAAAKQLTWSLVTSSLGHPQAPPQAAPPISVVICTRDRSNLLARCLASVGTIEYPTFEVIVVDNAPSDETTREAVRGRARYVREERAGLDWARNRGLREATYDIIAFTDDDVIVDPGWLWGIARGFQNPSIMAVTGLVAPMELDTPAQFLFERVYGGMGKGFTGRLFHRSRMRPSELIAIYAVGVGANMAFRRTAFEQVGEFDTALDVGTPSSGGGDLDMFHRIVSSGLPLWYEPRALVWHQHRREMDQLERQLYNDGRSFGVYLQKLWRNKTVPRRSLFRFTTWQWGRWLIGRVVAGAVGRHRMPLPLLWAGLRGALTSPGAYRATYRSDRLLRARASAPPPRQDDDRWGVTVIIPAFNASQTLTECLESVRRQTWTNWEVIVVDDGSTDDTVQLVKGFAEKDLRVTLLEQSHQGVSAARNLGLARARHPWVLFLDSDDWVASEHLERMMEALIVDPSLDAVHCGWSIATPQGEVIEEGQCKATGDLFHLLARHPAFIVHACIIRSDLVRSVGGFDSTFSRIQDWVMWQRVSRTGCRFGRIGESLAGYRMQPGSVSSEAGEVMDQALRAIVLGHGPDPAVPNAAPHHAAGRPRDQLPEAELAFLGWPAGIMLARGEDARGLLAKLEPFHWPGLATYLGEIIYSAAPRALGQHRSAWSRIWSTVEPRVKAFLEAVELHTASPGLSRTVHHDLARRILADSTEPLPLVVGLTQGARLELTEPWLDIEATPGVERLWCSVELDGVRIGTVELPVCGRLVPAVVLRDAVADRLAWTILGRFFQRHVYRESTTVHDAVGWDVLLREAWNQTAATEPATRDRSGRVGIEISAPLPLLLPEDSGIPVDVMVGGAPVGLFLLGRDQLASPATTRAAINDYLGYELCRAVVREALIGRSWDPSSLRDRLRTRISEEEWKRVLGEPPVATVLGRHPELPVGGSGSRRALLPARSLPELEQVAEFSGQRIYPPSTAGREFVAYVPERFSGPVPGLASIAQPSPSSSTMRRYDRHHFEASFARATDPWSYASEYEQTKYRQTLELIPGGRIERALELGCAEGHFTVHLAPRVERLVAADIADLALERAAKRCRQHSNVEYRRLDLVTDSLPGKNDLVVCSEVLYYAGSESALAQVANRIADAIRPGGHLLTAHAHVVADEPGETGFAWDVPFGAATIGRVFGQVPTLRLMRELKTPLYRVQLYRRVDRADDRVPAPEIRVETNRVLPGPRIAQWIRWEAGTALMPAAHWSAVTDRLPILMYHQVADTGSPSRARWRVPLERFKAQLAYLREAGFYSVRLDEWRSAAARRQALPGRAVMITFDDGYLDFAAHAWPLLQQYGFSAVLFVVSERVGRSNDWDRAEAAGDRLMDWDQLRRLRDEGLEIGSHSATHPWLRSLPVAEIVREAATSKATIQRELKQSVISFAYPFGDHDVAIQHLVGACGYEQGFHCYPSGRSPLNGDLMNQPRIEILGDDDLPGFIAKLEDG